MVIQGVIVLLIGIIALWQSLLIPHVIEQELWVGALPSGISLCLCVIGGYWIFKVVPNPLFDKNKLNQISRPFLKILQLSVLSLCIYFLISYIGFILTTLISTPFLLLIFEIRKLTIISVFTFLSVTIAYLLLYKVFNISISDPFGLFE